MRATILVPLALVACATTADSTKATDAELARLTAGRVAGPEVDCVRQYRVDGLSPLGGRMIVARGGNRIWISHLPENCPSLRPDSIPVVRTLNGDYCRNDMFTPISPNSPNSIAGGSCRLGRFTPYEKR